MRNGLIGISAVAFLALILEATVGSFPYQIFAFPLNILSLVLWLVLIVRAYRNRQVSRFAKLMLSRTASWMALSVMTMIGIVLGLQREPASTSWCVVIGILLVLTHLAFVILRGWRNSSGIRLRFILTHVGLWLSLGAGFWGAPDREQLRVALDGNATNQAYTMAGAVRILPYELRLVDLNAEPTNYEARVAINNEVVLLRVNHPYDYTISQKIYLASVAPETESGEYAILEIVNEPWQWLSMAGIVMLILGGVLLFVRGPRKTENREL